MKSLTTHTRRLRCRALSFLLLAAMPSRRRSATGLKYAGVNLSGAEIKSSQSPACSTSTTVIRRPMNTPTSPAST